MLSTRLTTVSLLTAANLFTVAYGNLMIFKFGEMGGKVLLQMARGSGSIEETCTVLAICGSGMSIGFCVSLLGVGRQILLDSLRLILII
jgi:hypothetical protein